MDTNHTAPAREQPTQGASQHLGELDAPALEGETEPEPKMRRIIPMESQIFLNEFRVKYFESIIVCINEGAAYGFTAEQMLTFL